MYFKKLSERYLDKKKLVTDLIRTFIIFIFGLLFKYSDNLLIILKKVFGEWIITAIFYKICLPISLLILLIICLFTIPYLVKKYFVKTTTKIIKEWIITTIKTTNQWTNWNEIDLNNSKLRQIKLRLKVRSSFMRFGVKLLDSNAQIMGEKGVLNNDNNILIHISKQIDNNEIRFIAYKNGVRDLKNIVISQFDENKDIKFQIKVINNNNIQFIVNNKMIYSSYIIENLLSRVCLMSWGDGHEYNLIAEDIKIVTEKI